MKRGNKFFKLTYPALGILLSSCLPEIYDHPSGNVTPAGELLARSNISEEKTLPESPGQPDPNLVCCDLVDRRENPSNPGPLSIERGEKGTSNQKPPEAPVQIKITISKETLSSSESANFVLITIREFPLPYDPDSGDTGPRTSSARVRIVPDLDFTLPAGKIPYLNIHCYIASAI